MDSWDFEFKALIEKFDDFDTFLIFRERELEFRKNRIKDIMKEIKDLEKKEDNKEMISIKIQKMTKYEDEYEYEKSKYDDYYKNYRELSAELKLYMITQLTRLSPK